MGTNRDLGARVREGRFREDLLARIDLWTFTLPGLSERPEDIEPNIDYELELFAQTQSRRVRFTREARTRLLSFATSPSLPLPLRRRPEALCRLATKTTLENDADRLRKYLARFDLSWDLIVAEDGR